jgi:fructuronate reductase
MDGSQKLPQRLLGTLRDGLKDGRQVRLLCHAIAAWMRYVGGTDEWGQPIDVRDPLKDVLQARLAAAGPAPRDKVMALIAVAPIFGDDLRHSERFVNELTDAYTALARHGARQTLIDLLRA